MLGTREGVEIGENAVAFDFAGILYADMLWIGVHGHNLFLDILGAVGKIDAVAKGFAHLRLAIDAGQAQAGIILRQHNVGINKGFAINRVEFMHDFLALLQHGQLVLANRHNGCLEGGDISSLADRIAEEAGRDAGFKVAHFNLVLYGRVALQTGHGNEVHIIEGKLSELRHHGLNEQRGFCRIKTNSQIVERYLDDVLAYLVRVFCVVGECLCVSNHNIYLIVLAGILQLYTLAQRAYVVTYMQASGRTVAGKNNFAHVNTSLSYLFLIY